MSSHHSQKWFNLHHDQVNAGRARKEQRQKSRLSSFLEGREQAIAEVWCVRGFEFLCFAYLMLATAVYMGRIV